ncbi:EAL domain-containing protein [Fontimonas sp. SYSU GA230001]|uniref:putative bifunctional diguanylate cyclase/phosphodiesterase n=1 Tax=Fontimonas sp. SYSU GA230001 TaxID=3142450 RepID=UPI0032B423A1
MDDVTATQELASLLDHAQAVALLRQFPQPLALIEPSDMHVCVVSGALAERCRVSEPELCMLSWAQLRQLFGDAVDCSDAATRCSHLHPVDLNGRRMLLWLADHCALESAGEPAAARDDLTGLLSRRAFETRLRQVLAVHSEGALVRFEVDQFKLINDAFGNEAGNRLIVQLGQLMNEVVRSDDDLARLGGDEFAVLLAEADTERAWQVAERVRLHCAAQGFEWNGRAYGVTLSAGVAAFADAYGDPVELMSAAATACSGAKARGRNRIEIYRREDRELHRLRGEQSWGARVLDTLEANRFALYQQRIEPLHADAGVTHHEVLLRVRGISGWTPPGEFVAAAERYGLMPQVDRRVIARVLRELSRSPAAERPVLAINLSGHSLSDQGLAAYVARVLEQNEVAADRICFEITETAAIANTERAVALVSALKALGCTVALDDFGAGMSSFGYLKTLAVDILKIDGGFVRNAATDPVDSATIDSMVRIARLRGLKTIAECVEDEATLDCLRGLGVDYAQGYHLHRPEAWSLP